MDFCISGWRHGRSRGAESGGSGTATGQRGTVWLGGEEGEVRWHREAPSAGGQGCLCRPGPGILLPCPGHGWPGTTTSCLGRSQRRELGPGQESRKGREIEEGTPVSFPWVFFQGHCCLGPQPAPPLLPPLLKSAGQPCLTSLNKAERRLG